MAEAREENKNGAGRQEKKETKEFKDSHHARGGKILGSLDNVLAEVVEGHTAFNNGANPAAASGCWQCHGSKVALLMDSDGNPVKDDQGILLLAD